MRVRPWAVIAATLVALLASPPLANAAPPGADPPGRQLRGRSGTGSVYAATIRRTEYGIPHVLATDFGGLGYGYGHAFAEDNLCTLAETVVTVSGDRSRHFGPDRLTGDQTAFTPVTNLDSDMYYRSLNDAGTVSQLENKPAPLGPTTDLRALVAGYVAGYNRYLRDKGVQNLPDPTCRGQAWVRPMTATDMWRILYDANQLAGLSSLKGEIGAAQPGAAKRAGVPKVQALPRALGSNAIAVGRDASRARTGMLLANPHFPWTGINRIYQVQMTIPGVMNVTGGSFYGTPVVEIGHTSGVAWTHTISPAQRFTLFQLRLAPDDPTKYEVDGQTVPMTSRTVQVPVRLPSGEISNVSRTLYSTRYGPMMASGWSSTAGFAIRGASANNLRSFNEWLAMGRSQSVQGLRAAQDAYQGLPFVYTVAADSTGVAHLSDSSVVPHVTDEHAQRCVTPEGRPVYPGQTILDGARSECDWGSDGDAIEPGIFAPRVNPSLTRADHVSNANQSAWLSNPAQPVTGYPRIYGDIGTERTLRTRLGLDMINSRIGGSDGLGTAKFDLATLQSSFMTNRNLSAELGRNALVALCRSQPVLTATDGSSVSVTDACDAMAGWDLKGDTDSRGAVLWRLFWFNASTVTNLFSVAFDPRHPTTTPNTLNTSDAGVRRAFADAVQTMNALPLAPDVPLGAVQHTTVGGSRVAVPGCTEQEGCYNIACVTTICGFGPDAQGKFAPIDYGTSFLMAVEFQQGIGPKARTILTYSQSQNPASPHHNDQTLLYSAEKWVTGRYTEEEIASDPKLVVSAIAGN